MLVCFLLRHSTILTWCTGEWETTIAPDMGSGLKKALEEHALSNVLLQCNFAWLDAMVTFLIVIIYNIHMQQVYKWVLSAVTLASILIALRLLVDRNLLVCGEYIYGSTLHTMKKTSLILTEGAQVEILVPCNSSNPCLPSSMLVMPIITESSSKTPVTHFQSIHALFASSIQQVYVCLLTPLYEFIPSHSPVNGCASGETTALPAFIYSGL